MPPFVAEPETVAVPGSKCPWKGFPVALGSATSIAPSKDSASHDLAGLVAGPVLGAEGKHGQSGGEDGAAKTVQCGYFVLDGNQEIPSEPSLRHGWCTCACRWQVQRR